MCIIESKRILSEREELGDPKNFLMQYSKIMVSFYAIMMGTYIRIL